MLHLVIESTNLNNLSNNFEICKKGLPLQSHIIATGEVGEWLKPPVC